MFALQYRGEAEVCEVGWEHAAVQGWALCRECVAAGVLIHAAHAEHVVLAAAHKVTHREQQYQEEVTSPELWLLRERHPVVLERHAAAVQATHRLISTNSD